MATENVGSIFLHISECCVQRARSYQSGGFSFQLSENITVTLGGLSFGCHGRFQTSKLCWRPRDFETISCSPWIPESMQSLLKRQGQEVYCKFEANLVFVVSFRLAQARQQDPVTKSPQTKVVKWKALKPRG